jgi:hypothetical protein
MNATKCERCPAIATKSFFFFDENHKITLHTKVCDGCYEETGLNTSDPKFTEVFPIHA